MTYKKWLVVNESYPDVKREYDHLLRIEQFGSSLPNMTLSNSYDIRALLMVLHHRSISVSRFIFSPMGYVLQIDVKRPKTLS